MKKFFSFILLAAIMSALAQNDANMGIIPVPVSVKKHSETFNLDKTVLLVSNDLKKRNLQIY